MKSQRELEAKCRQLHARAQPLEEIAAACQRSLDWVNKTLEQQSLPLEDDSPEAKRRKFARLIQELDEVRRAAWIAWERSSSEKVKQTEKVVPADGQRKKKETGPDTNNAAAEQQGDSDMVVKEQTMLTESLQGNPMLLRIMLDCNKRESTLWGFEKNGQPREASEYSEAEMREALTAARKSSEADAARE